jgi:PrtD family type I secretion system ABC transporter
MKYGERSISNSMIRAPAPVYAAFTAYRGDFAVAFGLSGGVSALTLTVTLYMLQVYDRVLASRSKETLLLLTVMAFAGLAALGVFDSLRLRLLMRIGLRISDTLGARVLNAMVTDTALKGDAAYRHGLRDIDNLQQFIGSAAFAALLDAPFLLLFLGVLFYLHWAFFAIVLTGGAILLGIALLGQALTATALTNSMNGLDRAHNFADDGLHNAQVLEGMGMSAPFVERYRKMWRDSLASGIPAADGNIRLSSLSRSVRQLIQIAILGVGALLVLDFAASAGVMIAASILGARALAPIESAASTWRNIVSARAAWNRLESFLAHAPERQEEPDLPAPRGDLQFQKVSYVAPFTRKAIAVNLNFSLKAGESLGIIGPSGSGKSTLVRLLTGAWPATSGTVRLDGANIYTWPRHQIARHVGYLPQNIELFSGTVSDNIARFAEPDPDSVVKAAMLANAHQMILSLPNGYNTEVGAQGHQLSGGERQRIALARALYGDPKLVALDEPNSNLDTAGEEALKATLASLKKLGVTVIVIAHRPIILSEMDKLMALREGAIEAFGPRDEVMKRYTAQRAPAGSVA